MNVYRSKATAPWDAGFRTSSRAIWSEFRSLVGVDTKPDLWQYISMPKRYPISVAPINRLRGRTQE